MIHNIILSIDYGEKKIGLALKPKNIYQVEPLVGINHKGDIPFKILELCKYHQVNLILLGLPLDALGAETSMSQKVRSFYSILRVSLPKEINIELVNERYSTQKAWNVYRQNTKKKKNWEQTKDSLSAVVILENYLTEFYQYV